MFGRVLITLLAALSLTRSLGAMRVCISNGRDKATFTMNVKLWKIRNLYHTMDNNIYRIYR